MMQVIFLPAEASYLARATAFNTKTMKPRGKTEPVELQELNAEQIRAVLRNQYIGSLAFIWHQHPYVLPITYYFDEAANCLISYSTEGHKIEAMRNYPAVSLGVYEMESPMQWKSVLVHGRFEELHQTDAKVYLHRFTEGVRKRVSPKDARTRTFLDAFSSATQSEGMPVVFRIKIADITGKSRSG